LFVGESLASSKEKPFVKRPIAPLPPHQRRLAI